MGNITIFDRLRVWIGGVAWKVVLWALHMTSEQYKREIYLEVKHTLYPHHNCRCVVEEAQHDNSR